MTIATRTLPVVDLAAWRTGDSTARRLFADRLRGVCHDIGFFQLTGHGVPDSFLDEYFAALKAFFALSEETKALIDKHNSPWFRGWERVGAELTNNRPDIREQLDISSEHLPYPPDVRPVFLRLDGPNQWLPDAALPGFRRLMGVFFGRMGALATELMQVLAVGLGLAPDHFLGVFGERPLSLAKLIRYPATPAGQAGVNEHHDAGFLTLLLQHGVGGLQALDPDGSWIDVEPRADAFVVNLGEMLQEMTGNYFVATTHRVIAERERYSSAYFHGPDLRTRLDRLVLDPSFAGAVAASPRHHDAGFMAKRDELLVGLGGTSSDGTGIYGQQLWNYYVRSYPANVRAHHADML
jgi:isopenicillin N synthase-like dioxygenase